LDATIVDGSGVSVKATWGKTACRHWEVGWTDKVKEASALKLIDRGGE
jgi:hypothetical protein